MVITPEARLVWPDLFEPVSFKGSDELYRCVLLIDKTSDLGKMKTAIYEAALKKWPTMNNDQYNELRKPIRDGDKKAVDDNGKPDKESFYFKNDTLYGLHKGRLGEEILIPTETIKEIYIYNQKKSRTGTAFVVIGGVVGAWALTIFVMWIIMMIDCSNRSPENSCWD